MSHDRIQPMSLAYAPPTLPGHDYKGPGVTVVIRMGEEVVGYLSRKGWDGIGFLPRAGLSSDGHTVRYMVYGILRDAAAEGVPMVEAWARVLNATQHDAPVTGRLDGFGHPLAD